MATQIKIIKIGPEFKDERGYISRIIDEEGTKIKSILYIVRKKNSLSANHFHKKDIHYILCLEGEIKYSEKNMKIKNSKIVSVILHPGEMVKSNQYMAHSTEFLKATVMLAFSTQHRDQERYEKDTIRVDVFDKKLKQATVKK